jgi:hypothetical protein
MRRFRRAGVLVLFVMIALFFPLLAPPPHRIDEAHFALIRHGMTAAEVEAIFGVPAGNYDWAVAEGSAWLDVLAQVRYLEQGNVVSLTDWSQTGAFSMRRLSEEMNVQTWTSRHGSFYFASNANGSVTCKGQLGKTRIEPPWERWWRKFTAK